MKKTISSQFLNRLLALGALLLLSFPMRAQTSQVLEESLVWNLAGSAPDSVYLPFEEAFAKENLPLPVHKMLHFEGRSGYIIKANIEILKYSPAAQYLLEEWKSLLPENIELTTENFGKNNPLAKVSFVPYFTRNNTIQRVEKFRIVYEFVRDSGESTNNRGTFEYKAKSVLSSGEIFKLGISENGIYTLTEAYLRNTLNLNPSNISPKNIKIYSTGRGINPSNFEEMEIDDLEEIPVFFEGNENNSFEPNEKIYFYARNHNEIIFEENNLQWSQKTNIYDNQSYVFLKIEAGDHKQITQLSIEQNPDFTSNAVEELVHYEVDRENLMHFKPFSHGSGQLWFGDFFRELRTRDYSSILRFRNPVVSEDIRFLLNFAARTSNATQVRVTANGKTFSRQVNSINFFSSEFAYVEANFQGTFPNLNNNISFQLDYFPTPSTSFGWLDFISVQAKVQNIFRGSNYIFRDSEALNYDVLQYELLNAPEDVIVWDITQPLNGQGLPMAKEGGKTFFRAWGGQRKEFIAFSPSEEINSPVFIEKVNNQNLHALSKADMIIVYPSGLESPAKRLHKHREEISGLHIISVLDEWIYNEFGGGIKDPESIRNFVRMIYERSPNLRYLLLFGDATFDARNIYNQMGNPNFYLPVFQTTGSRSSIFSYPSDDFYALLDEDTSSNLNGNLDIAVGRIPSKSERQAQQIVNKIIHYDTSPETLGDWKNRLVFLADDEDNNRHVIDSDLLARNLDENHPEYNVNKIYIDAFNQVSTPGGQRYPEVNQTISSEMFRGIMLLNYFGHGGFKSMAQEQIMTLSDVESWTNRDRLPIFITATCSFAPFDDVFVQSIGEEILLKENGGAIALFTTTRDVFATQNLALARSVFRFLFTLENGKPLTFGEILRRGKNNSTAGTANDRKFALIGDPSQTFGIPTHKVITQSVNERIIEENFTGNIDTLGALCKVTVSGFIADAMDNLDATYNGVLTPTIYDKATQRQTLGQDPGSPVFPFLLQNNILFRGNVTVKNGVFEFSFVVPKDIRYDIDKGKFSYYASTKGALSMQAHGAFKEVAIGGSCKEIQDDLPPTVEVFMNTESFVRGGITDRNPRIIAKISDDTGINVTGTSIGHDITATLNADNQNAFVLNDFFESSLDDYTSGEVIYPLFRLEPGSYSLRIRAWDVANNPGEGFTDFIVASDEKAALERVLNYPNPFTDNTYFQFEHNIPSGIPLFIKVDIFTVSGKLVKTVQQNTISQGSIITDIQWNGRDDFQQKLAAGVYIYKVKIRGEGGVQVLQGDSDFEKLVILN